MGFLIFAQNVTHRTEPSRTSTHVTPTGGKFANSFVSSSPFTTHSPFQSRVVVVASPLSAAAAAVVAAIADTVVVDVPPPSCACVRSCGASSSFDRPPARLEEVAPLPLRRGGAPPSRRLARISLARRRASLHFVHHARQSLLLVYMHKYTCRSSREIGVFCFLVCLV